MKSNILALALFAFMLASPAFAADSYLCIADQDSGFRHQPSSNTWKQTRFHATAKLLVKKGPEGKWTMTVFGGKRVLNCRAYASFEINCASAIGDDIKYSFVLWTHSMRFV